MKDRGKAPTYGALSCIECFYFLPLDKIERFIRRFLQSPKDLDNRSASFILSFCRRNTGPTSLRVIPVFYSLSLSLSLSLYIYISVVYSRFIRP